MTPSENCGVTLPYSFAYSWQSDEPGSGYRRLVRAAPAAVMEMTFRRKKRSSRKSPFFTNPGRSLWSPPGCARPPGATWWNRPWSPAYPAARAGAWPAWPAKCLLFRRGKSCRRRPSRRSRARFGGSGERSFRWPKSSLSSRPSGIPLQLTGTKGRAALELP